VASEAELERMARITAKMSRMVLGVDVILTILASILAILSSSATLVAM
jgi:hypothetical protein